jgi:hypothetical protein
MDAEVALVVEDMRDLRVLSLVGVGSEDCFSISISYNVTYI